MSSIGSLTFATAARQGARIPSILRVGHRERLRCIGDPLRRLTCPTIARICNEADIHAELCTGWIDNGNMGKTVFTSGHTGYRSARRGHGVCALLGRSRINQVPFDLGKPVACKHARQVRGQRDVFRIIFLQA